MQVKLISATKGSGEFEGKTAEDIITYAARVSSSRETNEKFKDTATLLNYCIKNKHWSIFETATITMEIKTSKAIGIQLLRHRSFTFQELSQRYAVVGDCEPIELREQATNNRQSSKDVFDPLLDVNTDSGIEEINASDVIENYISDSQTLYKALLEVGVARECARMVLPMATSTTIFMTGSVRSWIHLISVRNDNHAQKEIVEISKLMKKILTKELPLITKALDW